MVSPLGLYPRRKFSLVAMRGYYQIDSDLDPFLNFFLTKRLLPGYGWVFPLADGVANIGIGLHDNLGDIKDAFDDFVCSIIKKQTKLNAIRSIEKPVGFPIFTDFPSINPVALNLLMVGEAAGLTDPLTGEGIAFALRSGELAANVIYTGFMRNDFSIKNLMPYEQRLRKYRRYFTYSSRLRDKLRSSRTCDAFITLLKQGQTLQNIYQDKSNMYETMSLGIQAIKLISKSLKVLDKTPYLAVKAKYARGRLYN
jgi:flavin-dependent dehydrogenase